MALTILDDLYMGPPGIELAQWGILIGSVRLEQLE
jgi:hypothetical protein